LEEVVMKSFVAGVAAVASAFAFVAAAGAGPPLQASGSGVVSAPVLTNVRSHDGITFADFTQAGTLTGTFEGTMDTTGRLIVFPDGRVHVEALVMFVGATPCGTGMVLFRGHDETINGIGTGQVVTVDAAQTVSIHAVIALALAGPAFTYSGSYHCGH
jgi:hypothetical protein